MDRRTPVMLAVALVGYSHTAGLPIPGRRHPVLQALLGTALAGLTGARPGLRGAAARSGLRLGLAGAALASAGVAGTTALPAVRSAMRAREVSKSGWRWLTVEIPLGTVWAEEMTYRAALAGTAAAAFGPRRGRLLQAVAFGLSHVADARAAGESVVGTVLVTGTAGWVFGWLGDRSGSILAPALAHLAINEAGAVAALIVRRAAVRG